MADSGSVLSVSSTCYKLYPIWGNPPSLSHVIYSQDISLAIYVDGYVTIEIDRDGDVGCFYVEVSTTCISPINTIFAVNVGCTPEANCYTIGGEGIVNYINEFNDPVSTYAPVWICSTVIPEVISDGTFGIVHHEGVCSEGNCFNGCYSLENCSTGDIMYSSSSALITPYVLQQTVTLEGYEGCWTVDTAVECTCLVDVVIKETFANCTACLPIIAYKLTNCKNNKQIKYTLQDLASVVGKSVSLDCGDCWLVELINYQPPSTSVINIENIYDNCSACTREYWILYDCAEVLQPLITYTDVSAYLHQYVKLVNDNTCWYVENTTNYIGATTVSVVSSYEDCPTCSADATCICTKITNTSTESKTYTYVDCENITQTFTLAAGAVSDKTCVKSWTVRYPSSDVIETFGDCYEDSQTQTMTCPAVPTGRVVAPGYSVPTCSIEKYEEISCRSSEILYHQVLQARYGISNCCPDEDDKWLLQKELADLASLLDKNYTCDTVSGCCSPASCNCSSCIN